MSAEISKSIRRSQQPPIFQHFLLRKTAPTPPQQMAASAAMTASIAAAKLFTPSSSKFKQPLCAFSQFKTPTSLFYSSFAALSHHPHHRTRPQYLRFSTAPKISATISVGDKLPDATLSYFDSSDELQTISISDLTSKKKTILIAVPGAFTPTCSQKHLPGFVEKVADFKAKGVDTIACISVNDAFVMKAWKENLKVGDDLLLLSDGNGDFTKSIGCELDLSDKPVGLGVRSRRYAIYLEDGVVKILNLEEGGAFNVSSAEDMLKAL